MPTAEPNPQTIPEVERCVRFLKDLELRWSGARRSRAIIEQLLAENRRKAAAASAPRGEQGSYRTGAEADVPGPGTGLGAKRSFEEFEGIGEEPLFWHQIPGSELFGFESVDPGLFSWGGGM